MAEVLRREGWTERRRGPHGLIFSKYEGGEFLSACVPLHDNKEIPERTLGQILSVKQTRWGKRGLQERLKKHGLLKDKGRTPKRSS